MQMMVPQGTNATASEPAAGKRRKHSPVEVVRSLQTRIAKAQVLGKGRKVKALQRLLTHSQSGRIIAVERVASNDGRKTPGVDGQT
jgi:hypothetical protein